MRQPRLRRKRCHGRSFARGTVITRNMHDPQTIDSMSMTDSKFSGPVDVDEAGVPVVSPSRGRKIIVPIPEHSRKWHESFPFSWIAFLIFLGWFAYLVSQHSHATS